MRIELKDLSCGYRNKAILKNIDACFEIGEKIAVLGPNGIGKTTLFKTLLGFLDILKGRILVNGKSIKLYHEKELASVISYVPQAKNYSYQYTVEDMILMGRASHISAFSKPSKNDINIAIDAMKLIGLLHLKEKYYSQLSGGEQQCVLIARAVAQEAKFIIMDEPASNLDLKNQKLLLDVVNVLAENGTGVIMSTHSPEHAFSVCDKVLLIDKQGIAKFGKTADVLTVQKLMSAFEVSLEVLETKLASGITKKTICLL